MLICPQCQFENPDANKFCQSCGTSLTHKLCHECGTSVTWDAQECPNCGANVAAVWWVIIYHPQTYQLEQFTLDRAAQMVRGEHKPAAAETITTSTTQSPSPQTQERPITILKSFNSHGEEQELEEVDIEDAPVHQSEAHSPCDPWQRYHLSPEAINAIGTWRQSELTPQPLQLQVIDKCPLHQSLLDRFLDQQELATQGNEENLEPADTYELEEFTIPALAFPYIALQDAFNPAVPAIHDAWQHQDQAVILLEDRSQWQMLGSAWVAQGTKTNQILYWLNEMANLWAALEPWDCCQSLLQEENLRLDEDQTLCLQQLYPSLEDEEPLTLQALGRMWQILFAHSERTLYGPLTQLIEDVEEGIITTVEELRSQLQTIYLIENDQMDEETEGDTWPLSVSPEKKEIAPSQWQSLPNLDYPPDSLVTEITNPQSHERDETDVSEMQTVVLPMRLFHLDYIASTDIGCQRDYNEDFFGVEIHSCKRESNSGVVVQGKGLFIVCDGMGGHEGGEVASALAVETLQQYFQAHRTDELPEAEIIRTGIWAANQAIYDINQQRASSGSQRMGTTLAMAVVQNTNVAVAHVGDSRIYRYTRKQGLELLTIDHEVGQREIKLGVEPKVAYGRPDAYQLTQALGPRSNDFVEPDITYLEAQEDTLLILCSDGLSDNDLLEKYAQTYVAPMISSGANLEEGMLNLIEFANQYNGHDNITVVIVRIKVRPNLEQKRDL